MAVIVTGVQIPESCSKCFSCEYAAGTNRCVLLSREVGDETVLNIRANDCPLKSLDGLIDKINKKANSGQWSESVVYGMQKAIVIIKEYCED